MGNQESRERAIEAAKDQALSVGENLKEFGGSLQSGFQEIQEGAVCTGARAGIQDLDCCGADRDGSAANLAHRFDLPDDAQARPMKGLKKGGFLSKTTLTAGHSQTRDAFTTEVPRPTSSHQRNEGNYGLGILWLTRNSKMICAGFAPGSPAKNAGVKAGDILKAVDGTDILQMKVDGKTGKHAAGDLMVGKQGSICKLLLLRVENNGSPTPTDQVKLSEVSVSVPRVLPSDSFQTQHY